MVRVSEIRSTIKRLQKKEAKLQDRIAELRAVIAELENLATD